MTEVHSKETFANNKTLRDILLLTIWSVVLFLSALTLKSYYLNGQPPFWDNLSYQNETLQILTSWLDGNWGEAFNDIWNAMYPGYLLALATSFLLFGFDPISPYIVSAFFGAGCLIAVYLLSRELGAGRQIAFAGAIFCSLLPSFFYQNFLQTRNDFPAAFFIALSWVFLLRGIKNKEVRLAFLAGVLAGVGTLFKASTPGYVAWGILAFLALPEKYTQTIIKDRINLSLVYIGGAVIACGWHYLPNLNQTLSYYEKWGNAKSWVVSQYNLQSNWTDNFFYLKNIIFIHLGEKVALGVTFASGILLIRWLVTRRSIEIPKEQKKEWSFVLLIFMAAILPLIFISWRGSFSSLGDVPVLPLLAATVITLLNKISIGKTLPKFFLVTLLSVCLILSISNLIIVEKQFSAKDFERFSHETMNIRREFGLRNTPMMQVYSHPIYNVDTLSWLWLMSPKTDRGFVHLPPKIYPTMSPKDGEKKPQLLFPEDNEIIATKLKRYPLLIMSDFPGTAIQGEKFNTLNRLHAKINSALDEQGQFLKLHSMDIEDGRFPIHFMLNKNYSVIRPTQVTTDNWVEWKGEVQYFASRPAKLIWRGIPIRKIESFQLINMDNPVSAITLSLKQVLPDGRFEYQSEMVPPMKKSQTFIVTPESSDHLLPASNMDKRMLAFHKVEAEVIKYD